MTHLASKEAIRADLAATEPAFHALLESLSGDDWRQPSYNQNWTNGEILFHMAFAFFLLPILLRLACVLGRLPPQWTKPLAILLNLGTGAFDRINVLGPQLGGRLFTPHITWPHLRSGQRADHAALGGAPGARVAARNVLPHQVGAAL